jgi:hypothetical protein
MQSKTRFSGTARLIRLAGLLAMFTIAADGFMREANAVRSECGPKTFHCMQCNGQGSGCGYWDGGTWCEGVVACYDCSVEPVVEGVMCLTPFVE